MGTGEDNTPPAPSPYQDGHSARLYAFIARCSAGQRAKDNQASPEDLPESTGWHPLDNE